MVAKTVAKLAIDKKVSVIRLYQKAIIPGLSANMLAWIKAVAKVAVMVDMWVDLLVEMWADQMVASTVVLKAD